MRPFKRCASVAVLAAALVLSAAAAAPADHRGPAVAGLEVNAAKEPLGIDDRRPRFGWQLTNGRQTQYRVVVATSERRAARGRGDVWDSGVVRSAERFADYGGRPLASRTRYFWSVRVWTTRGSDTSRPSWFETAYLDAADWRGAWIAGPERRTTRLTPEEGVADDAEIRAAGEFCRPPRLPDATNRLGRTTRASAASSGRRRGCAGRST